MDQTRAFITGIAGLTISQQEVAFLDATRPWGLILFARNIDTPDQVKSLVRAFRDIVGRPDAPVLIDQEGGRVRRLRPPHWRDVPAAGLIAALWSGDRAAAERAAWLSGRLIGEELYALGITVDCFPVADLLITGAHDIIGDRAYGETPEAVIALAGAAAAGMRASGVSTIVKHIPGHGRARADSHLELPTVSTPRDQLAATDFATFAGLSDLPMAMTAHVVYAAIDAAAPATTSATVIGDIIRGEIGFDGLLMSDDLSMKALSGTMGARTQAAFAAGCDMALHCNGDMAEMEAVADATPQLVGEPARRAVDALAWARRAEEDCAGLWDEFTSLLSSADGPAIA
ncbi:MAG: beta-N-acetylhexosaminidase [Rhodobiaceae bacterium]|nr:beta-N-acetylhexosaminidase [Rhodobiaceae bacterium]MCC0057057.1 beta-N-acetylhexosaminidase [Rhodobiaceae bacterium]